MRIRAARACTPVQAGSSHCTRGAASKRIDTVLVQSITVGLPVTDLERSVEWYRRTFELDDPDLEPAEGIVEFRVGGIWLQLGRADSAVAVAATVVRFGVQDVAAERVRLAGLGIPVGDLDRVDGILEYFDFADPDGNRLSLYAELEP